MIRKYFHPDSPEGGGGEPPVPAGGDAGAGEPPVDESPPPPAPEPVPITDDVLFSELGKRYPDRIKGKEDLDKLISSDYSSHIVPKNELVKKLNTWDGDPEMFFKLSKLNVDAMDNKAAIIEDMKIKEGMSEKLAQLQFDKKYAAAFQDKTDEDFDEAEYELAVHNLNKDGLSAKTSLSQWKVTETEKGQQQPADPEAATKSEAIHQDQVVKPVQKALNDLQKLDLTVKITLPDQTEEEVPFSYSLEKSESKKIAEDILTSRTTDEFMTKVVDYFGRQKDGTVDLAKLAEPFLFFADRQQFIKQLTEVVASKALANHLKNVKPGDLADPKGAAGSPPTGKSRDQNIVQAMNKKAMEDLNK